MALEFRDGESLVIQADLPGLDPDRDIEIWTSAKVLHVRARSQAGGEDLARGSDLRDGVFVRDVALPPGASERPVAATYTAGRLEIRAPGGDGAGGAGRVAVRRDGDPEP